MKIKGRIALAGVAAAVMTLTGCGAGGSPADAPAAGESLEIDGQTIATAEQLEAARAEAGMVLYTGSGETGERQLLDAFMEDSGLQADLVRLVPNKLTERILSEHATGQLGADIVRIDGWDLVEQLQEDGAFVAYEAPAEYELPESAVHEGGSYFTAYSRPYVLAFNNQVLEEPLTSWSDLTDAGLAPGEIGVTQVNVAGSTHLLARFHFEQLGEEWLADVASTQPRIFDSASPLTDALARGEIRAGAVPLTVGQVAFNNGAPITLVAPTDGFPVNDYVIGLADGGSSPITAQIFLNWTLSRAGQAAATQIGDYPIQPDVGAPSIGDGQMPPLDDPTVHTYTKDEYMQNLEADTGLWEELFGYVG
jgi:iron(III) transport system substrate-binding protein